MTTSKLDKLKAQREELDKKIRTLAEAKSEEERKLDTRRKTIFGAWCMQQRPELLKEFIASGLTRAQDKAAFAGWTPPASAPTSTATPAPAPANKQL